MFEIIERRTIKMKYYTRTVSRREPINKYGKLGYPRYEEFFKTNDESFLNKMNYGKKIKFKECANGEIYFNDIEENVLYSEKIS